MSIKRTTAFRYVELASMLRAEILSGGVKPGELLLSEHELCHKYKMSRNSVRQALDLLTKEGLIARKPKVGTVVTYSPAQMSEESTLVILTTQGLTFSKEAMPLLIEMFKERHPFVNVKLIAVSYSADFLRQKIADLPFPTDIVLMSDGYFRYRHQDEFMPLPVAAEGESAIAEKLLQPFRKGNLVYGLPLTFSPVFMVYNRDLFRSRKLPLPKPDWTIEEFVKSAQALTADTNGDGIVDRFGYGLSTALSRWVTIMLKQGFDFRDWTRKKILSAEEKIPLVEALKLMQDLIHRHRVTPSILAREVEMFSMLQLYYQSKIAMILTTTYYNIYKVPFRSEIIPFPAAPGAAANTGNFLMSSAIGIPKSAAHPELAQLFCEFAAEPDVQRELSERTGLLSVYDSINRSLLDKRSYEALGLDARTMNRSCYSYELFPTTEAEQQIEDSLLNFWIGILTPEETADLLLQI